MGAGGSAHGNNTIATGGNGNKPDFQAQGTGLPNPVQEVGNNGGGQHPPIEEIDDANTPKKPNYEATTETQQTYESSLGSNFDDVSLFVFGMLIAAAVYIYLKSRKN